MKSLQFQNFSLIEPETDLSDTHKAQLLASAKPCFGIETDDVAQVLAETYENNCEIWEVVAENEPETVLYDVWVFNVDTAMVFYANTVNDTGVGMIQNDFDPIEADTEEAEELAQALQTAFDKRQTNIYPETDSPSDAYRKDVAEAKKAQENK